MVKTASKEADIPVTNFMRIAMMSACERHDKNRKSFTIDNIQRYFRSLYDEKTVEIKTFCGKGEALRHLKKLRDDNANLYGYRQTNRSKIYCHQNREIITTKYKYIFLITSMKTMSKK